MTRPESELSALPTRLQTFWARGLASLLLSLAGLLLGWQLSDQGHSRQLAASQTSPALPELRPAPNPQPAQYGLGTLTEIEPVGGVPRWTAEASPPQTQRPLEKPDLILLGRMNLDGG